MVLNAMCFLLSSLIANMFFTTVKSNIHKENGSYFNIVVAIDPSVPENPDLIRNIQQLWTQASQDLYVATKHHFYFGEIVILVPKTWENSDYVNSFDATHYFADVLVVDFDSQYTSRPWTKNYGSCGQQGDSIYMSPDYILEPKYEKIFGSKGKTIVHEWAHYRWGVFDEFAGVGVVPFYRHKNHWTATRCPLSLNGVLRADLDFSSGNTTACPFDVNSEVRISCQFIPYEDESEISTVSLMSHPFLDEVKHFCTEENHNKEAPNDHNRICDLRSTWEVITKSSDFADSNQKEPGLNTKPYFKIVKQRNERYVFALDLSASMERDSRLRLLRQVLYLCFAHYIPNGTEVGLVGLSNGTKIPSDLVVIRGSEDREKLIDQIPYVITNFTCIGCCLQESIRVLEKFNGNPAGSNIVVVTDGEENQSPYIVDIASQVLAKKIFVHAIFLATDANEDLKDLVDATNGKWYFSGTNFTQSVFENFFTLLTRKEGCEDLALMKSISDIIQSTEEKSYDVFIDVFAGSSAMFSFSFERYSLSTVEISLMTPFPHCDCTNHSNECVNCTKELVQEFGITNFLIPGEAKAGRWVVKVKVLSREYISFVMLATAKQRSTHLSQQSACLSFKPRIDETNVGTGQPVVISTELCQSQVPVLNAQVVAAIERPDGTTRTKQLFDRGAAPDVTKDDGVYSGYFFEYNRKGRYSIAIQSSSDGIKVGGSSTRICGSSFYIDVGRVKRNGTVVLNQEAKSYYNKSSEVAIEPFERMSRLHGFEYNGSEQTDSQSFNYPPSRVTDLRAFQTESRQIALQFSAPGGDLDIGAASSYEFRYIIDNVTQLRDNFESCPLIDVEDLYNFTNPAAAGVEEYILLDPPMSENKTYVLYGFSLRAKDERNETAAPSSIAVVTFSLHTVLQGHVEKPTVETEFVTDDDTPSKYYLHVSIAVIAAGAFLVFCFVCAALIKNQTNRVKTRENQRILDEYYGVFSGTTDYSKTMTEAGYEADNEGKTSSQNKSFDCDHTSELRGIKKQLLSIAELIDYKTSIETSPNANDKEKSIIQHRSHVYEQDSESSDSEKNFDNSEELNKYREVDDEPNDYSYSELD